METTYPVMISIYVSVYNHENYITRALDSILMQKTQYSYEVLVGEDCSTDNTRQILQDYEAAHPNRLTVFYRKENMYRQPVTNTMDLKRRCRGKYIIALEGDDFWLDENKLERQVSFLEEHPDYIAVAHHCVVVGEDSTPNGEVYPECPSKRYTITKFFDRVMPGQLTTVLCRNYMLPNSIDTSLLTQGLNPGDQLLYFALLCNGKIRCFQEVMSAYRHVTNHGFSYSATERYDYEKTTRWHVALREYACKNGNWWCLCNAEALCISNYLQAKRLGAITAETMKQEIQQLSHPLMAWYLLFWRAAKRRLQRLLTPKTQQSFLQRQFGAH